MLVATYGAMEDPVPPDHPWHLDGKVGLAWRVGFKLKKGRYLSIQLAFARERDAERAADALNAAGLTTPNRVTRAGPEEVRRIMIEALPW